MEEFVSMEKNTKDCRVLAIDVTAIEFENVDFKWKNFSFIEFFQSSFMIKCLIRVNVHHIDLINVGLVASKKC